MVEGTRSLSGAAADNYEIYIVVAEISHCAVRNPEVELLMPRTRGRGPTYRAAIYHPYARWKGGRAAAFA